MKFRSKPHEIDAFQFESKQTKPPQWFLDLVPKNTVAVVINASEEYISVHQGVTYQKARVGDWIAKDDTGRITVLSQKEMDAKYETS